MRQKFDNLNFEKIAITVSVSIILLHFITIIFYTVNFPHGEDIDVILANIIIIKKATGLMEIFERLAALHDVHFHTFPLLAAIITKLLFDNINFLAANLLGNLMLLPLLAIIFITLNKEIRKVVFCLPVIFLMCQPCYYEITNWTTASWAYLGVTLFSILALSFKVKNRVLMSIFSALLAIICLANGVLIFAAFALVDFFRRKFWQSSVHMIVTVIGTVFLRSLDARQGMPELRELPFSFSHFFNYLLSISGSCLGGRFYSISLICGSILWISAAYILISNFKSTRPNLVLTGFLLFNLLSILAVTYGRFNLGITTSYSVSRYTFFPILAFISTYLLILEQIKSRSFKIKFVGIGIVFSFFFCFFSYLSNLPWLEMQHDRIKDSSQNWEFFRNGVFHYHPHDTKKILLEAENNNFFKVKKSALIPNSPINLPDLQNSNQPTFGRVENFLENNDFILISGWVFQKGISMKDSQIILKFNGSSNNKLFSTTPRQRPDVNKFHSRLKYYGTMNSGFRVIVDKKDLPADSYSIEILIISNGKHSCYHTKKIFRKT